MGLQGTGAPAPGSGQQPRGRAWKPASLPLENTPVALW